MKFIAVFFLSFVFTLNASAQHATTLATAPDATQPVLKVRAACGKCLFGMTASECSLAVRIKGKTYFVDGAGIDDFGDAHAADGFCNATCQAEVQGKIEGGRFKATWFKLIPSKSKSN